MRGRFLFLVAALSILVSVNALPAQADSVVRYGISMADIPLTTGQPDRGAGAYQFTAYTIYDPLIAWEMDVSDRPGKLVPGLATEWKVDDTDQKKWRFTLRQGVKFHDGSDFNADAVIWNLDKVLNDKAPQFDKRQSAQVKTRLFGGQLRQDRRCDRGDHDQDRGLVFSLPDALVPGVQSGAVREARKGLGQVRCLSFGHRAVQTDQIGAAGVGRTFEKPGLLEPQAHT